MTPRAELLDGFVFFLFVVALVAVPAAAAAWCLLPKRAAGWGVLVVWSVALVVIVAHGLEVLGAILEVGR